MKQSSTTSVLALGCSGERTARAPRLQHRAARHFRYNVGRDQLGRFGVSVGRDQLGRFVFSVGRDQLGELED